MHVSVPVQVSDSGLYQGALRAARRVACVAAACADCRGVGRTCAAASGSGCAKRCAQRTDWRAWVHLGHAVGNCWRCCSCCCGSPRYVGELSSQQNIIAVVVDDSRSMAIADSDGKTREAAAVAALEGRRSGRACRSGFRRASTGWIVDSSASTATKGIAPTGSGDAHRRRAEATGGGDCGSCRWARLCC